MGRFRSSKPSFLDNSLRITEIPPASNTSSICTSGVAGLTLQRYGVLRLREFNSSKLKFNSASNAAARVCRTVLVLPPMAISSANAFRIVFWFTISRGFKSFFTRSIIAFPVLRTRSNRAGSTAKMVPLPGSASPSASIRQFIEFAVNIPEQEPQVGQPFFSRSFNAILSILPALNFPTPSNTEIRSTF